MNEKYSTILQGSPGKAFIGSLILMAAGYLGVSLWSGWQDIIDSVSQVGGLGTLVVLLLSLLNYALRFVRWQRYLLVMDYDVPWRDSLRIYLSGFALTTTPGKAGELVRSVFLKSHNVPYANSVAAFFSERLSDLIAVIMLAALGLWVHQPAKPILIGVAAAIVFGLILVQNQRWLIVVAKRLRHFPYRRLRQLVFSILKTVIHFRRCFSARMMSYSIFLGLVAWGAEGLGLYYVANWMGLGLDIQSALFIYAFSMLVGAISFLPGGIGGAEVAMIGLLIYSGMDEPAAIACTIFVRLATLWFAVALGMIALIYQPKALIPQQKPSTAQRSQRFNPKSD